LLEVFGQNLDRHLSRRGKWGYVEHGAKWNIPHVKIEGCFVLPHVPHSPTSPYIMLELLKLWSLNPRVFSTNSKFWNSDPLGNPSPLIKDFRTLAFNPQVTDFMVWKWFYRVYPEFSNEKSFQIHPGWIFKKHNLDSKFQLRNFAHLWLKYGEFIFQFFFENNSKWRRITKWLQCQKNLKEKKIAE
jgi:hypothetical protein